MIRFLQKLLPHQSHCGGCGKELWEWTRHPCPYCGSMVRNFGRFTTEKLMSQDNSKQHVRK